MTEIDHALRRQVESLQGMVVQMDRSLTAVGHQVAVVGDEQRQARTELSTLRTEFLAFVEQARLTANMQQAETKVVALEARLEHEFGHHKVVRRSATGMLQAFDVGLVAEETVRAISEELMVQTPRYWLAPALVALAAWAGDDQRLCDQAVAEAFRRSPSRTSLFLALVLRRQGRQASAVRWLRHYLAALDPKALGRDFAVILESISQGAFGPAGVAVVQETLDRWRAQFLHDDAAQQSQVDRWRAEIERQAGGSAADRFPRLAKLSPQWPALDRALTATGAHQRLITTYTNLATEEHPPSEGLEDAIDDILDRLVGDFDDEELPLRRELKLQHAIVAERGDDEAAGRAVARDAAALESTLDFLTIQTVSALRPEDIGVSRATQRLAVAACSEWLARAHASFTMNYRAAVPPTVSVTLGTEHNAAASALTLPAWTGSFAKPLPELEISLVEHWDRHGQQQIDGLAFDQRRQVVVLLAVCVPALVLLSLCANVGIALLVTVIGAGIWGAAIAKRSREAQAAQQRMRELVATGRQDSLTQLRAAGAELTDWSTAYEAADRREAEAATVIAGLSGIGHARAPYEVRTVLGRHSTGD